MRIYLFFLLFWSFSSEAAQALNGFDISDSIIEQADIVHGGPPRDGIPAILNPHYVSAKEADFLKPNDVVLGFEAADQFYAYPRYIMNWHELVNDTAGDASFLISYCPLCGTGMAFNANIKGTKLTFGVSGLLYNNDLLFYDKQTESLWSQIERRAISGQYVKTELEQLNLEHTTWQRWLAKHPDTKVLSEQQGIKRNYRHDPYSGYETSSQLFFKSLRKAPDDYHNKERVLGVQLNGLVKAYPFSELRKHQQAQFTDQLGEQTYQVLWDQQSETASIKTLDDETIITTVAFWFAWYSFHPKTQVFKAVEK